MAVPGFFNENANRAYPFVLETTTGLPKGLVVDAGFILGVKARYDVNMHIVQLTAVRRVSDMFYFDFTSTAPELVGETLTFGRDISDEDYTTSFLDSGDAGLSETSESLQISDSENPACIAPLWEGFLVTGKATELVAALPSDGTLSVTAEVEPALLQNLGGTHVAKLAIANADRTRVTPPAACEEEVPVDSVTYIQDSCVVGPIVFTPGYNAVVRQNPTDNSITLIAAVGAGAGQPCASVPLYPEETPPEGSSLLEGGPRCNETIRSVNGIGGPILSFLSSHGVTVTAIPETSRIVIDGNMTGLALCYDRLSEVSESC